jgi:hypothetical protein
MDWRSSTQARPRLQQSINADARSYEETFWNSARRQSFLIHRVAPTFFAGAAIRSSQATQSQGIVAANFAGQLELTQSVPEVLRATLPVIAVLSLGVLLITYAPWLTTLLPKLID